MKFDIFHSFNLFKNCMSYREQYRYDLTKVFAIWEGGIAIYGGVIGGFIAAVLFCKFNKFPLMRLMDIVVPSLILGQAIGRWDNFVNQEAF